jgi:hypothetical protein
VHVVYPVTEQTKVELQKVMDEAAESRRVAKEVQFDGDELFNIADGIVSYVGEAEHGGDVTQEQLNTTREILVDFFTFCVHS